MSVFNAAFVHEINSGSLKEASGTWAASCTQGVGDFWSLRAPWWLRCAGAAWVIVSPSREF